MKKRLLLPLLCSLTTVSSFAQSGICGDNLTWTLSNDTLTISGTGEMTEFSSGEHVPWFNYRSQIAQVEIGNEVTSIQDFAFDNCTGLTSISIGNSVTSLGFCAFAGCIGLTSVSIPESVTSIGMYAFSNCRKLSSVTIPNRVTNIGMRAFYLCSGLTSICMSENVSSIESETFIGCSSLTSVIIPNSVKSIRDSAFYACTGLTSVSMGDSVTSIGYQAFAYCSSLTSIRMSESVISIGYEAFYACSELTSMTIPNSLTSIGTGAFANTRWYDEQPDGIIYINNVLYAYKGTMLANTAIDVREGTLSISGEAFENYTNLTAVTIPNSLTSIGYSAFAHSGLTSVIMSDSVASIGSAAFYGCNGLTSVIIPNSVTSIGNSAFYLCCGLTSVSIGNSVTSIGDEVFYGCSGLTSITNLNPVPVHIDNSTFYGVNKNTCVLKVPAGSVEWYRQAPEWQEFLPIVAIEESGMPEIPAIQAIRIYPNPTTDNFRLDGIEENTLLTITDMTGKMIGQQAVNPDETVEVGHWPTGVYLVNVNGKTVKINKR